MNKKLLVIMLSLSVLGVISLVFDYSQRAQTIIDVQSKERVIQVETLEEQEVKEVFSQSLLAANNQDIAQYVKFLIPAARGNTKVQLTAFFEEHQVEHTLEGFRILRNEENHILAEAMIRSITCCAS